MLPRNQQSIPQTTHPGVHRIELPHDERRTVNAWLIEGDPLTLVDTGLGTDQSVLQLRQTLTHLGYDLADIQQIVITHAHLDHFGAAASIVRASGAPVLGDADGAETMADFRQAWAAAQRYRLALFAAAGAPSAVLDATVTWGQAYARQGEPIALTDALRPDGEIRMGSRTWRLLSVPGHAASSLAFFDPHDGLLLSGDILVGIGAANVTLHRVGDGRLPAGWIPTIAASLRSLQPLDARCILPGHGPVIGDPATAIQERLERIDRRLAQTQALLADRGQCNAYQISLELYGDDAGNSLFGLSQAIGYLDALDVSGVARAEDQAGTRLYSLTQ